MKRKIFVSIVVFLCFCIIFNGKAKSEIIEAIDTPTAKSIDFGSYSLSFRLYEEGSILSRLYYGIIMENLTLGISLDTENVVGTEDITLRRPYLYIKLPLFTGNMKWPALCVGFDEQGFGNYEDGEYQFAPMGFFLVLTKSGLFSGLNVSAGINAQYGVREYTQEDIDGFANFDFTLSPEFVIVGEGRNLNKKGYANFGAKYFLKPEVSFEIGVLNVGGEGDVQRILRANYEGVF